MFIYNVTTIFKTFKPMGVTVLWCGFYCSFGILFGKICTVYENIAFKPVYSIALIDYTICYMLV